MNQPPIPPRPDDYLLMDPLPESPMDMGALVNISRLEVGKTYILSGILNGSRRYQYVTVQVKLELLYTDMHLT